MYVGFGSRLSPFGLRRRGLPELLSRRAHRHHPKPLVTSAATTRRRPGHRSHPEDLRLLREAPAWRSKGEEVKTTGVLRYSRIATSLNRCKRALAFPPLAVWNTELPPAA